MKLQPAVFAAAALSFALVACSSDDEGTSSSSSGSSGASSSGTGTTSSSTSSSGSTSTSKRTCTINGTCYGCSSDDALRNCISTNGASCTAVDASECDN